jgi:hypothetical protein
MEIIIEDYSLNYEAVRLKAKYDYFSIFVNIINL